MTKSSPGRADRRKARKSAGAKATESVQGRRHLGKMLTPSMEISIEKLGFPGSLTELHVVPQFPHVTRSDQDILTDNSEREFEAAALLSKAPSPATALNFEFTEADGESYFIFASPRIAVDTQWGTVIVGKNANSEASMVKMTCWARSATEALERLQLACAAFLDHWAYVAGAPVYLTRVRSRDLKNKCEMIRVSGPFRSAIINPSATEIPTPLRPILALYREGLGSASPIYKFLCFYKILEGYLTRLKPDLAKLFRAAGLSYPAPSDCVPDHPDIDPSFRAYIGHSITNFRDNILRPDFRDAVAHFEKDGLSPVVMSNYPVQQNGVGRRTLRPHCHRSLSARIPCSHRCRAGSFDARRNGQTAIMTDGRSGERVPPFKTRLPISQPSCAGLTRASKRNACLSAHLLSWHRSRALAPFGLPVLDARIMPGLDPGTAHDRRGRFWLEVTVR